MKKYLLVLVVALFVIVMSSCGNKTTNDTTNNINETNVFDETVKENTDNSKLQSTPDEFIGMDTEEGYFIDEYTGSAKIIIVPDELDGKPVVGFDVDAFHNVDFEEMVLPKGMKKIEKSTFANRVNLKKVTLNEGLEEIGNKTFINCTNIEEITIPSSVTKIGDAAFCGCTSLKSVILNEGLQYIGSTCFSVCAIESIIIPESIVSIDDKAISICDKLKEIRFLNSSTDIHYYAIDDCPNATIYGYTGSTAEDIATQKNIPFIAIDG